MFLRKTLIGNSNTQPSQSSMEDFDRPSTHCAALIGSNDDLLTEILIRLPASAILRFKSVSKHWRWLLRGKHFTLRYDSLSKSPGLFVNYAYIPFDVENRITPPNPIRDIFHEANHIRILQSCNGLMLCYHGSGSPYARIYYVINPTTKQYVIVPSVPGGESVINSIHSMSLAFHHIDCPQYKVVCFLEIDRYEKLFQIQMYSSDTRKWKICVESFFLDQPFFKNNVYWNGAIHWCPCNENHLYFRIDSERLQSLPLPSVNMTSVGKKFPVSPYLGESRGHLSLIITNIYENIRLHNVFEMLSDYSGWFVKYKVKLDNPLNYECQDVVDVIRGEKEEDSFMVFMFNGKLMKYKFHAKSFEQLDDLKHDMYIAQMEFHRYIEKLGSF